MQDLIIPVATSGEMLLVNLSRFSSASCASLKEKWKDWSFPLLAARVEHCRGQRGGSPDNQNETCGKYAGSGVFPKPDGKTLEQIGVQRVRSLSDLDDPCFYAKKLSRHGDPRKYHSSQVSVFDLSNLNSAIKYMAGRTQSFQPPREMKSN